jgi:hypothetical protein
MQACLICGRYDEALDVYDDRVGGQILADEWQWGGGQGRSHPVCKDLALRAMGGSSRPDSSARALQLFNDIQESRSALITVEALLGVVSACDNEGKWEDAVDFFFSLTKTLPSIQLRLVRADELYVLTDKSAAVSSVDSDGFAHLELVLNAVMQACNASRQFGVALLCHHLLAASHSSHSPQSEAAYEVDPPGNGPAVVHTLCPNLVGSLCTDELLAETMVSLCGVGCFRQAISLFEAVDSAFGPTQCFAVDSLQGSRVLHEWASAESGKQEQEFNSHGWDSAFVQIHRIASACATTRNSNQPLSPADLQLLSFAISSCVKSSVILSQPEMGIYLGKWSELALAPANAGSNPGLFAQGHSTLPLTDSYFAAAIAAFTASGKVDIALNLVEAHFIQRFTDDNSKWILSCNETVRLLFAKGRTKEALSLFREALAARRNPDMFRIAAKGLADHGEWKGISDVYRLALTSGCLSEDLSLLAMKSAASGRTEVNIAVLRNFVVSNDQSVRFDSICSLVWLCFQAGFRVKSITDVWHF